MKALKWGVDEYTYFQDKKIHDLIALFTLSSRVLSQEALKHVSNQGRHVLKRIDKNPDYYEQVPSIRQFKLLFAKMIDHIDPS